MLWYNSNSQCAGGRTGTELDRHSGLPRLASPPPSNQIPRPQNIYYIFELIIFFLDGICMRRPLGCRETRWGFFMAPKNICTPPHPIHAGRPKQRSPGASAGRRRLLPNGGMRPTAGRHDSARRESSPLTAIRSCRCCCCFFVFKT